MKKSALLASSFVILIILGSFPVFAQETETESHSSSQSTASTYAGQGQSLQFSIVPVPVPSRPDYRGGSGGAYLSVQGTTLSIHLHVEGAASRARFALILVLDNANQSVASMTTDEEGELEAEAQATVPVGNISVGLRITDTSTFGVPTLVMTTSPASGRLQLPLASQTTSVLTETEGQVVSPVGGGESDDGEVRSAITSMVIPAVIQVGPSGSSAEVVDSRFSISVGPLQSSGLLLSVSAVNVTGPRVILVNLTAPAAQNLFSGSVLITLDGAPIQQGSSVSQVLGARTGDPATFVIYSTNSGLRLLISIPHFSFHTIQVLPILAEIGTVVLDSVSLVISVAAASAVMILAYVRRTRYVG